MNNMKRLVIITIILIFLAGCLGSRQTVENNDFSANKNSTDYHYSYVKDFSEAEKILVDLEVTEEERKVFGAIVPHHILAAKYTAGLFNRLRNQPIETVVIIGPNHFNAGSGQILISAWPFQTPYGVVDPDLDVINNLIKSGLVTNDEQPFRREHSISVPVSFIKKFFPRAKIVPIIIMGNTTEELAEQIGIKLAKYLPENSLVVASCDFAHHVDNLTAIEYDKRSIEILNEFDVGKIYNMEVDSPASIYSLVAYLKQKESEKFILADNINAAEILNDYAYDDVTSYVTGFFTRQTVSHEYSLPGNEDARRPLRMLFWGDMMLDRHVGERIERSGLEYIFEKLASTSFFANYDLISANLEGTVTNNGQHYDPIRVYDFAFQPDIINGLKKYNFNFFNLANNHFDDQGARGMKETRENLDSLGFDYSGCSNGVVATGSSKVITLGDKKIGMVGFSALWNQLDPEIAGEAVAGLSEHTDLIIINIHWGEEYMPEANEKQQALAHLLIDAGADIIIGHHPHVTQGIETYKNKLIFYSLGNFIFDQYFSEETQAGLAVEIIIDNEDINYKLHPFQARLTQPELIEGEEKENIIKKLMDERGL